MIKQQFFTYKGYTGSIEFSLEDDVLFGHVQGIKSLISYEGETLADLKKDFEETIDFYLETCKDDNEEPEKPFKGSLNIRIPNELHEKLAQYALSERVSLNREISDILADGISKKELLEA